MWSFRLDLSSIMIQEGKTGIMYTCGMEFLKNTYEYFPSVSQNGDLITPTKRILCHANRWHTSISAAKVFWEIFVFSLYTTVRFKNIHIHTTIWDYLLNLSCWINVFYNVDYSMLNLGRTSYTNFWIPSSDQSLFQSPFLLWFNFFLQKGIN